MFIVNLAPSAVAKLRVLFALCVLATLTGCASVESRDARDPLEPMNRAVFGFNQGLDHKIIRPVATTYAENVPKPIQNCVGNVFSNLADIRTTVNQLLQGHPVDAASDASRFSINTTVGVLGCFDPATSIGLQKHKKDFGGTFAVWGAPPGAYLVLPLLGPSDVRDAIGLVPSSMIDPVSHISSLPVSIAVNGIKTVDTRASLLGASNIIDSAALDPYQFTRDAFFSIRQRQIFGEKASRTRDLPGELNAAHASAVQRVFIQLYTVNMGTLTWTDIIAMHVSD